MLKSEMQKLLSRHLVILFILLSITGCASIHQKSDLSVINSETKAIYRIVTAKQDAVNNNDLEMYLNQINTANKEYFMEQKRWFQYYQIEDASDYGLKIVDLAKRDNNTYVAKIIQSYKIGPKKREQQITFNEKFIKTDNKWKDDDLEFQEIVTEHFIVRAMPGIPKYHLNRIAKEAETAYGKVVSMYENGTNDKTVIKLYNDQSIIKGLTHIGIKRSEMHGWYEHMESIKIFVNPARNPNTSPIVAHELIHKITLSQSSNLCVWFAEGLADYYGTFNVWRRTYIGKGWLSRDEHIRSIKWMEEQNFEALKGRENIVRAYSVAAMIVKHIETTYGQGKSKAILEALSKYPQRGEEGFDYEKHNQVFVSYLNQAIENVLKTDMATFDKKWLIWIKEYTEKKG